MEETFYKQLIQESSFGYAYHKIILDESGNAVDYQFIEVNIEFEKLTGLKSQNIINKCVTEIIPGIRSDAFDWIGYYGEIAINGGKKEFESYSETLKKWYKVEVFSHKKHYFVTFFTNITDKVDLYRAKDELKFQDNLLDSVGESVIATDLQGNIKFWNRAAEKIYGWSSEEAIGQNIINLISIEKSDEVFKRISNPQLWQGEYLLRKKDGTIFPAKVTGSPIYDKSGAVIGRIGISNDITKRKIDEENLMQINEKLKQANSELKIKSYVLEQSPSSILITDKNGKIEYVNPNFSKITEYSYEEAIGKNPRILNAGYHTKAFYKNLWNTILNGQTWSGEILNKSKSGNLYWEYALISGVKDENGEIQHFVAVKDNITDLKKAHEEVIKAKKEADEANNAKSIFLTNMSHEIRTPLNAIIGFSHLLDRDEKLSEIQKEYAGIIIKSGEHLLDLINSILEISKIESGKIYFNVKNFDLYDTFDSIYKMFKERCQTKDIVLKFKMAQSIPRYVNMDESKLKQIFINLLGNAVKFTETGEICVRIDGHKESENKYRLKVEIEDTGHGISDEEIGRLFKFFEQTASGITKGSGTGIGLAISKKLIEMMGGSIKVSSKLGDGTIFTFEILLNEGDKDKIENSNNERVIKIVNTGKKYTILVVDDSYVNLFGTSELLKTIGFETLEASDGKSAVKNAEDFIPDLILMDVRMPIMDGYEAIKIIKSKENTKNIPVIIVTADIFEDIEEKISAHKVEGYIRKPFKENELFHKIGKLLNISYVYEKNDLKSNGIENEDKLNSKKIPDYLLDALKNAAKAADYEVLLEIVEKIKEFDPVFSKSIKKNILNYDYSPLENI